MTQYEQWRQMLQKNDIPHEAMEHVGSDCAWYLPESRVIKKLKTRQAEYWFDEGGQYIGLHMDTLELWDPHVWGPYEVV